MKLGLVGLPNVGKSTLFNALTSSEIEASNYPFCTIEPNTGIVPVPDARLGELAKIYNPAKITPAILEFVDIAGLIKGASKGEGLGNKFLADIREVDAIIHVVRCFENADVTHVDGSINPARDIETVNLELIFSDIEILARRLDKAKKALKGDKSVQKEIDLITALIAHLEEGKNARAYGFSPDEAELLKTSPLLSNKPIIYAGNVLEDDKTPEVGNAHYKALMEIAAAERSGIVAVCAEIEAQIAILETEEEREEFRAELGIQQSGLQRIIQESYALLGLISFLTAGEKEVRAWTIRDGFRAPQAAGKIHTDFERGFIKAEIVAYDVLVELKSDAAAKEKGLMRLEGKEYVVKDGDVILFKFNV